MRSHTSKNTFAHQATSHLKTQIHSAVHLNRQSGTTPNAESRLEKYPHASSDFAHQDSNSFSPTSNDKAAPRQMRSHTSENTLTHQMASNLKTQIVPASPQTTMRHQSKCGVARTHTSKIPSRPQWLHTSTLKYTHLHTSSSYKPQVDWHLKWIHTSEIPLRGLRRKSIYLTKAKTPRSKRPNSNSQSKMRRRK